MNIQKKQTPEPKDGPFTFHEASEDFVNEVGHNIHAGDAEYAPCIPPPQPMTEAEIAAMEAGSLHW